MDGQNPVQMNNPMTGMKHLLYLVPHSFYHEDIAAEVACGGREALESDASFWHCLALAPRIDPCPEVHDVQ